MFKEYSKAYANYYNKLKIVPVPLICWDFFSNSNQDIQQVTTIQKQWKNKIDFHKIVAISKREIIITDESFQIVFATVGLFQMNGYQPFEVIGKTPKIFQGELTSKTVKQKIKESISQNLPFKETLLNYKKDGSTYLCEIEAYPKFNRKGELVNYVAFERIAS